MVFVDLLILLLLAAASGCGMGSGGLLVVYLTIFKDTPQITAQALNLLFYVISASSSSAYKLKTSSSQNLRSVMICSLLAAPGIFLGTFIRNNTPESALRTMFGVLLLIIGGIVGTKSVRKIILEKKQQKSPSDL